MTQAGFLDRTGAIARKRFARAVSETASARAAGRSYSHTYVSRWLGGTVPRDDDTRNAIREALGGQLGRVVALDELGFPGDMSPDIRPMTCSNVASMIARAALWRVFGTQAASLSPASDCQCDLDFRPFTAS